MQAIRWIAGALALAGVTLPDAAPERFCIVAERVPVVVLADLDGAAEASPDEAAATNGVVAASLLRQLLPTALVDGPLLAAMDARDVRALVLAVDDEALRGGTRPRQ